MVKENRPNLISDESCVSIAVLLKQQRSESRITASVLNS